MGNVSRKRGRCVYRGGNWNNGTNAGVFYLNGNNSRTNSNTNIGFRSALALFVSLPAGHGSAGTARQKGHISRLTKPKIHARAACRWRPPGAAGKPRRLADPASRERAAGILWCGGHRGTADPRSVTRGPLFRNMEGARIWKNRTNPPFWSVFTRGRTC